MSVGGVSGVGVSVGGSVGGSAARLAARRCPPKEGISDYFYSSLYFYQK